ncbi:hypothetical protein [Microbacterium lacticum]|uniref:Uncharacterized protein n=1 Tax=Microbacterium lacticum TaxID=33885 RepID=A0A543L090_9MICO|nr:hypothetical protein [Microbacterium lacticum]TQN00749.1 hypothetical protein FHX68_0867 [Microbacterium lacticum]
MSTSTHRRRRSRVGHDDIFWATVTVTGLLAYIGYGFVFALTIGGGR